MNNETVAQLKKMGVEVLFYLGHTNKGEVVLVLEDDSKKEED